MKNKMTAYFLAYQEDALFNTAPIALFNIRGGNRDGSTVSKITLKSLDIKIPKYPTFKQWGKLKCLKK